MITLCARLLFSACWYCAFVPNLQVSMHDWLIICFIFYSLFLRLRRTWRLWWSRWWWWIWSLLDFKYIGAWTLRDANWYSAVRYFLLLLFWVYQCFEVRSDPFRFVSSFPLSSYTGSFWLKLWSVICEAFCVPRFIEILWRVTVEMFDLKTGCIPFWQ